MNEASVRPVPAPGSNGHKITNAVQYFQRLSAVTPLLPLETVDKIVDVFWKTYSNDRTLFMFGNGGSAALASHVACDLGKGTAVSGKRRFRTVALTDNIPLITAWANDARYDDIFSEQLSNLVDAGDAVLAISGSGNSRNVLNALKVARQAGAVTVGLGGFAGGKMKDLCDYCLVVPSDNMQIIEDLHVSITHSIYTSLLHRLTSEQLRPVSLEAVAGN
jgi:D-sedoheptulose 7-phosphate isomerase